MLTIVNPCILSDICIPQFPTIIIEADIVCLLKIPLKYFISTTPLPHYLISHVIELCISQELMMSKSLVFSGHVTCMGKKLEKMGCYRDKVVIPKERPLPRLLLTDRDPTSHVFSKMPIDWRNWNSYTTG